MVTITMDQSSYFDKNIFYANSNFDLKTPAWMDASPEEVHLVTGSRMTDG